MSTNVDIINATPTTVIIADGNVTVHIDKLEDAADAQIVTPADKESLVWDASVAKWVNSTNRIAKVISLVVGDAQFGDKGPGSINAEAYYIHGKDVTEFNDIVRLTETAIFATVNTASYATDFSTGALFELSLDNNINIVFSNIPTAGKRFTATFVIRHNVINTEPTFPATVQWLSGIIPVWYTGITNGTNLVGTAEFIEIFTYDGGLIWYGTEISPPGIPIEWYSGTGTPEGSVFAPVGSMYSRTDGGAGTSLYVKEVGTGSSGWGAK